MSEGEIEMREDTKFCIISESVLQKGNEKRSTPARKKRQRTGGGVLVLCVDKDSEVRLKHARDGLIRFDHAVADLRQLEDFLELMVQSLSALDGSPYGSRE